MVCSMPTKTVIYCSYLPGYVGCIYDDDKWEDEQNLGL